VSRQIIGIVPAAGAGTRIQPLAFSKEVLPVACMQADGCERPKAVSEFLVDRMLVAGADRICFVISPQKTDIVHYYARTADARRFFYAVQEQPLGLCDAIFRALPLVSPRDEVLVGLPDTIWLPEDGLARLPRGLLSFLLFPVDRPERFDAVVTEGDGEVREIEVKVERPKSSWIWGAFRMPGSVLHDLHRLWREPGRGDEYVGTLVNEYLRRGGRAVGLRAGTSYHDVGTIDGYRTVVAQPAQLEEVSRR
jgi:dTDP-glucose pyrophosphorylase